MIPERSVEPADWLEHSSTAAPGHGLHKLVPRGYEATLRIFHPLWDSETTYSWTDLIDGAPLRWDTPSPRPGRGIHGPDPWLDVPQARALVDVLDGSVARGSTVWIGSSVAWALYDAFEDYPTYRAPRQCLLYRGDLPAVMAEIERDSSVDALSGDPVLRPYQWWPQDRSWYVISDIDVNSTLIAGRRRLLDRVHARLESRYLPEGDPDLSSLSL